MSTPDRRVTRQALATLLRAHATSAALILAYQAKDFSSQSPVIVVTSAGSERERLTLAGSHATFVYHLHLFVAFAGEDDATYTDSDTEDLLDQIEREIAQMVDANQRTPQWHALSYARASDAGTPVKIGGVEYRHEIIALAVAVSA